MGCGDVQDGRFGGLCWHAGGGMRQPVQRRHLVLRLVRKRSQPRVDHKYCYSNYYHGTKGHASTAQIAGNSRRVHAAAGDTSNANLTAGLAYTRSTFYSVD
ncbi:lactococcin 972 family bacteriocin [Streptomyces scopuliridis]|uniref:lactococcin 972 family bacteriocin n=1 Tax=Streptomyces scopuliridis TaxID=452529 RepID=UPI0036B3767B